MNNQIYDVVIVGGGPSGSTCAYYINGNLNTLIIDKFDFPRFKACGGLLNSRKWDKELENFHNIKDKLLKYSSKSIVLYFDRKRAFSREYDELFNHVDRSHFDYLLQQEALKKNNVKFRQFDVININKSDGHYVLSNGKEEIRAKYIVGADGWDSVVSKYLGNKTRTINEYGLCLEKSIICDKKTLDNHIFYLYRKELGYAWLFPTEKGYYLGLGFVGKTENRLNHYLDEFTKDCIDSGLIPRDHKVEKIFGAPDPMSIARKYCSNDIILCGDALGVVNQSTGEGIYYAMITGKIAGQALSNDLDNLKINFQKAVKPIIEDVTFFKKIPNKKIVFYAFNVLFCIFVKSFLSKKIKERIQDYFIKKLLKIDPSEHRF